MPHIDRAWTSNHQISIPDIEIKENKPEYIYVPLRGHGYTMAVYDGNDTCIGYILSETLGCSSVSAWMALTKWIDQGY